MEASATQKISMVTHLQLKVQRYDLQELAARISSQAGGDGVGWHRFGVELTDRSNLALAVYCGCVELKGNEILSILPFIQCRLRISLSG